MTDKNGLLVATSILNRVVPMLEEGSRVQLTRQTLSTISDYLTSSVKHINKFPGFSEEVIIIVKTDAAIKELLSNDDFVETDSATKVYLGDKLIPCITNFKVKVGKYYTEHDFDYMKGANALLKDIIDTCIDNGYYFGIDVAALE